MYIFRLVCLSSLVANILIYCARLYVMYGIFLFLFFYSLSLYVFYVLHSLRNKTIIIYVCYHSHQIILFINCIVLFSVSFNVRHCLCFLTVSNKYVYFKNR